MSNVASQVPDIPAYRLGPTAMAIADAAIRVIASTGFDTASVRCVAAEAGVTGGTVQYHFATREDLLVGALRRVGQRLVNRIYPLSESPDPFTRIHEALLQMLPLDEERRQEAVVFVAFGAAASTRSSLATVFAEENQNFHDLLRMGIDAASAQDRLHPGIEVDDAVGVVVALVNGLLLEGVNAGPQGATQLQSTLRAGLARVLMPPGA